MTHLRARAAGLCFAMLLGTSSLADAAKDVVTTTSGDRLVGEIKSVEKDVLTLSTDYSDSDFKIKWEKIASIESDRQFLVETFGGQRLTGVLSRDPSNQAAVRVADSTITLPDVSSVEPFERTLWSRFDAGFDLGFSATKANSAQQFTVGGKLLYRSDRDLDTALGNVFRSSQANAPTTARWDLGNEFR